MSDDKDFDWVSDLDDEDVEELKKENDEADAKKPETTPKPPFRPDED
jgi:hypothetical protein